MSDVKPRYDLHDSFGPLVDGWVPYSDYDALKAELDAAEQDCRILCNALQRIEAGEAEPRMIARRTLEHSSEKAALASVERERASDTNTAVPREVKP
jgi:hypothetical protein